MNCKCNLVFILILFLFNFSSVSGQNISQEKGLTTAVFTHAPAGLMVNTYSGSLFTQRADLYIPCRGFSIDLLFSYNSSTTALDLGYGPGWTMTYSMSCKPDSNKVIVRRSDGRKDIFEYNGSGYIAPVGLYDTLIKYLPGKFKLTTKNGINYFFDDSIHHRLTSISDPNSNTLTLSYTDSLPTIITDPSGRNVMFAYSGGHLTQITDPNFSSTRTITFQYDANKNPITVTDPLGNSIHYQYDGVRNMIRYVDQLGNQFNINYQNCTNVTNIASPINSVNFSYDVSQLKTTVTQLVNNVMQSTSYKYDSLGNMKEKIGNCCGFHQLFNYDLKNNIIQKTDANGNNWNYLYDTKGNDTHEADPLGATKIFVYESLFNHLTSKKDKRGNITSFIYDSNGNLVDENKPLGITEHFTHDSFGNVLSHTDGKGFTTQYAYNSHGDLILITFPGGATNAYTYDNAGNRLSFTDANGNTLTNTYNALNRLLQSTDALSHTTQFIYDVRGSLVSTIDALTHSSTFTYDILKRKISTTKPSGTSAETYDEAGNELTSTDNNGNVTLFTYDIRNRLTSETDPLGHSKLYTYDNNGNLISETDKIGNITNHTYDMSNRRVNTTDAISHNTIYSYDADGNRISTTDANGHTKIFSYDALNRLIKLQKSIGFSLYTYDNDNNRTSMTDPNGHTTSYEYDSQNRQISVTDALGHISTFTYDLQDNLVSSTDRNGHTTTYVYDALNRKISETNPLGETTSMVYNSIGNITGKTLSTGNSILFNYDTADRIINSSDVTGVFESFIYDANSNRISRTDALGHATNFMYDAINRVVSITDAMGNASSDSYDNNSNVVNSIDKNGHTTNYTYDALNRKIKTTHPLGNFEQSVYDAVGNTISLIDHNGNTTTYMYDVNDRKTRKTFADGTQKNFTYDTKGNIISRMDNNNNTTNYSYDVLDHLITRDYPGTNDDHFTYDFGARILTANNNNATIAYTYDNVDRMLSENLNGHITAYVYDIANRIRTITYPSNRIIEEDYDSRMRLSILKENALTLVNYTYDALDRRINRSYINGTTTSYTYNNNNWITSVNHSGSSSIEQLNYSFDNEGNRLVEQKINQPSHSEIYLYDNDDRLINYKVGTLVGNVIPVPTTQTQFTYDGAGNRIAVLKDAITTNYSVNNINEYSAIVSAGTITPGYDANGNVTNDGIHTYGFDFDNHLVSVDGGATATYKYDALGRRIQKAAPTSTINYYYKGNTVIEERDNANAVLATYVGQYDEVLEGLDGFCKIFRKGPDIVGGGGNYDEVLEGLDGFCSMRRGGQDYFYHTNSLGSVIAITNSLGVAVERYEYDAYGKPSIYNGLYNPIAVTSIGNTNMFTDREYDSETDSYHYRARFYKTDWGRFGQRDPKGYKLGLNLLEYVSNNPINWIDPSGMDGITNNQAVKDGFSKAFADSKPDVDGDPTKCHEEGGWITKNVATGAISVKPTSPGKPRCECKQPGDLTLPGRDFFVDEEGKKYADKEGTEEIIAGFHTHPETQDRACPSETDVKNADSENIPEYVISENGVTKYDPKDSKDPKDPNNPKITVEEDKDHKNTKDRNEAAKKDQGAQKK